MLAITLGVAALAGVAVTLKWLRVAQREHYIAGWVGRIAALWLIRMPANLILVPVAVVLIGAGAWATVQVDAQIVAYLVVLAAIIAAGFFPIGLSIRGTSSPMNWTARARRLLVAYAVLMLAASALVWWLMGVVGIALVLLVAPLIMDLALIPMNAVEKALSNKYLVSARKRLNQVRPTVVAITGSYGKTSTKGYVAHLLDGSFSVVASPASFNNLMGLSRAVNDRVIPGTEVFVAEMGVYGPGEIRELSKSFPPDIATITTIGEAHLARMGSREVIAAAKAEITEKAATVVLPIDQPELAALAEKCRQEGKTVITVSTSPGATADVVVDAVSGQLTMNEPGGPATLPVTVSSVGHAVNIAVAAGIAFALKVPAANIAGKLDSLPGAQHRAEIQETPQGVVVIDDTYNSNPVGAERALEGAAALAAEREGQLVVVTPGMVELGSMQRQRNSEFAASVAARGGRLLAVGRTNRAALQSGADGSEHPVLVYDRRKVAVEAALDLAGERGVILYENDLPDHYP
jgi:UDP-N-acetylmuramoyl-tripeptide--D-alanyl-D-alanine ligase